MGIARRMSQRGATVVDLYPGPAYAKVLSTAFGQQRSYAGKTVSVETAMICDAVAACVQLLAGTIGGFPIKVYEGDENDRTPAPTHPTAHLLGRRPNSEHPPVILWGLVMTWLATWGDAFLGKTLVGSGRNKRVELLLPIRPDRVEIERVGGRKIFWLDGRRDREWSSDEIIHIQGFTLDGLRGISPIGLAREAIGAGLAIDEYANRFFANSALPIGVLQTDQELGDDAQKRLRRDWSKQHRGLRNAGKIAILEQGLKWQQVTLPLKDLEFVAFQNLTARKIARMYRVPASKIDAEAQQGKGLHYTSGAGEDLAFLKDPVRVWLKRITQSLMLDEHLFPAGSALFCEHDVSELLDVDPLTQAQIRHIEGGGKAWRRPSEFRAEDNLGDDDELDELAMAQPPDPIEIARVQADIAASKPKPAPAE